MNTILHRLFKHSTLWLAVLSLVVSTLACNAIAPVLSATATTTSQSQSTAFTSGPIFGTPLEAKNTLGSGKIATLDELAEERYTENDMTVGQSYTYTIHLDQEQDALWGYGWQATTQAILDDNLSHIAFEYYLNDDIVDNNKFYSTTMPTDNNHIAQMFLALLRHWPSGVTTLKILVTFKEPINDGERDYSPGVITLIYKVTR